MTSRGAIDVEQHDQLITELRTVLSSQQYSPVVIGNYCAYARAFVKYLAQQNIEIAEVSEVQVAQYLQHAIAMFRKRRDRSPGKNWHSIPLQIPRHVAP